jgi:hypothetical protein
MKSRFGFVFAALYLTAILLFTVFLRTAESNILYKLYITESEQYRLKQELGKKQMRLESLINPASLSKRLDK